MRLRTSSQLIRKGFLILVCLVMAGGVEGGAGLCLQQHCGYKVTDTCEDSHDEHRHAGRIEEGGTFLCSCRRPSEDSSDCKNVSVVVENASSKAVVPAVATDGVVDVPAAGIHAVLSLEPISNPVLPSLRTVILLT